MFIKLDNKKILVQLGYSKQEIADTRTEEKDENGNDVITFGFDSGFSYVECTDEDVLTRIEQLDSYVKIMFVTESIYNIKWSDSKVNCEEVLDIDGKSQSPKVHVKSHFKGDDTAKDARLLADKWTAVRRDRDRKLTETDYLALSDSTLASNMKTYRQALRDVPADNADPDDISWPVKP